MRKIPTLFQRTEDRRYVIDAVTPGCEWVLAGEGVATRKYDGTCVLIRHAWYDGPQVAVWCRREVKPGKEPPPMFEAISTDEVTGKTVGWEPYAQSGFAAFVEEALGADPDARDWPEGTYELCGPKINGNPEGFAGHVLVRHGAARYALLSKPQGFDELRRALTELSWEGIVWHHPDGRMAKLKRRDFRREAQ